MSRKKFQVDRPPIVEAVVDIDCNLPSNVNLVELEQEAGQAFHSRYPKSHIRYAEEHSIKARVEGVGSHSSRRWVHALQFRQEDEKQLIQLRPHGYSFNRLAPYTSLDDYMDEIRRTWGLFKDLTAPSQIRTIRLRYINRIFLPLEGGKLDFDDFFKTGPRLPANSGLEIVSFFNQYSALEPETGSMATVSLTIQESENEKLPTIFDISAHVGVTLEPDVEWTEIWSRIQSLRKLKNHIFKHTLTKKCLALFQTSPSS